jgi:hypothetical protein
MKTRSRVTGFCKSAVIAAIGMSVLSAGEPTTVTFTRDVFPILQARCVECHRPGEMAPMSLQSYQEVRPWAAAIREAVLLRRMPPWYAEAPPLHFANDWSLTPSEIQSIKSWVDAKAPEGDLKDLPPARRFAEGWQKGESDQVLAIPEEVTVPASGADAFKYILLDYEFPRDTWVRGFELRPGNRKTVHHANIHVIIPKPGALVDWKRITTWGEEGGETNYINRSLHTGLPGRFTLETPPGSAILLPKGSHLRLDIHHVPSGKVEHDRTRIGLYFANGAIDKQFQNLHFSSKEIRIPPNTADYRVSGVRVVEEPITVYQVACHMHLRGKSYRIVAELPDGRQTELMNVPHYNFGWQQTYELATPIHLPPGTKVRYLAAYDNSAQNTAIGQYDTPDREVDWGERTRDEMMGGHVLYTADAEHVELVIDGKTGHVIEDRSNGPARAR